MAAGDDSRRVVRRCGAPHPTVTTACDIETDLNGQHFGWHSDRLGNSWPQERRDTWKGHDEATRNRAASFRKEANLLLVELERYEDEHPHVDEGAPCLARAVQATREALGHAEGAAHGLETPLFQTEAEKAAEQPSAVERLAQAVLDDKVTLEPQNVAGPTSYRIWVDE